MPFRIFLIPVLYSDEATKELNAFIAGHRVAHIERNWIDQGTQSAYVFCVEYVLASPTRDSNSKCKRPVKRMLQVSLSFPVFREVINGKAAFGGTMGTMDF